MVGREGWGGEQGEVGGRQEAREKLRTLTRGSGINVLTMDHETTIVYYTTMERRETQFTSSSLRENRILGILLLNHWPLLLMQQKVRIENLYTWPHMQ